MRVLMYGIILVIVVAMAGCGGGGGGGATPASLSKVPTDMVGTWQVPGLGLPDDEMGVQADGDVIVNSDVPATRSDSQTRIGSCSADGTLALNGSWRLGGVDYSINASGRVQAQTHSLTMQATIVASSGERRDNQVVSGDRVSGTELSPPAPPVDPPGGGTELPPPPPGDGPDDGDIETTASTSFVLSWSLDNTIIALEMAGIRSGHSCYNTPR